MNDILIAVIASVPGLLMGIAALRKSQKQSQEVKQLRERLDERSKDLAVTQADLEKAQVRIGDLERGVEACERERRALIRENLDLYRRLDKRPE